METPEVVTRESTFTQLVDKATTSAPRVPIELTLRVNDPFEAYCRARNTTSGFFFETSGGRTGWGYFGIEPVERITVWPNTVSLEPRKIGPSLSVISEYLRDEELIRGPCEIPYPCGLFGWISYDVARELEPLLEEQIPNENVPRLQFGLFETVISWRSNSTHENPVLHITSCPRVENDVSVAYNKGLANARELCQAITTGDPQLDTTRIPPTDLTFERTCTQSEYERRVNQVKEFIRAGDTFQANISQELRGESDCHPLQIFSALRSKNPAPYSALIEFPEIDLMCSSPELLIECTDGTVTTEPIAGTRPRGTTTESDLSKEAELRRDEKERAEHAMLVDLERNDLGKIASVGSVTVDEYRRVDRYTSVMHLVSRVTGELRDDKTVVDAVASLFPGGTITGAPKPRTMEIIDAVEQSNRGPYTGSIGIFGFDDRATLNIIIRTIIRKDNEYSLRVGGGIVHDSVPAREYQETLDKAEGLIQAIKSAGSPEFGVRQ